jgi:FkbM family methyltransferase
MTKIVRIINFFSEVPYFYLAKFFFKIGYFRGSNRLHQIFVRILPINKGFFRHPIGFLWPIDSRSYLKTYISSCEPFTTKVLASRTDSISTFICVGANLGWYPLIVGSRNKDIALFAFEPNPEIYKRLEVNLKKNGIKCQISNEAISNFESSAPLYMPIGGNEGMSTLFPAEDETDTELVITQVLVNSIDNYFRDVRISNGEVFILMDCEGGELKALEGAKFFLETFRPTLILEVNPKLLEQSGSDYLDSFRTLQKMSYDIYWIDERQNLVLVLEDLVLPHINALPRN